MILIKSNRPEQLNLAEDPYFIPDLDINFDLTIFGFPSDGSTASRSLSPSTLASSQSSLPANEANEPGLEIPSFDTTGTIGAFDVDLGAGAGSIVRTGSRVGRPPADFEEEPALIDEPVFDMDDDGFLHPTMLRDIIGADSPEIAGQQPDSETGVSGRGETGVSGRGETLHDITTGADALKQQHIPFDDGMMVFGDDEPTLPPQAQTVLLTPGPAARELPGGHDTSSVHRSKEISETAEAPQRRTRPVKSIRPDQQTELNNRDLNNWNQNYLANMAAALRGKQCQLSRVEAKRNAEFWILQQGLGNVASTFGDDRMPHPLAVFSGQSLWDMLRGPDIGKKRPHGSSLEGDDHDEDERRVRARIASQEGVARGDEGGGLQLGDDDGLMLPGDDFHIHSEVGRHAPPSLPDRSSGMPWTISGSRHSSAQPLGSGLLPRLSSSVGGLVGGMELGPPSAFGRQGLRVTSASPLLGRGPSLPRLGSQEPSRLMSSEDEFADLDLQLGADMGPDFELYGPSAAVDTQTAAQSQWVETTLENEAFNFLAFVCTKIQEKVGEQGDAMEEDEGGMTQEKITLGELLSPAQNSQIVGAQALLHVLALATKGLLEVYQAEPFGEIEISAVRR